MVFLTRLFTDESFVGNAMTRLARAVAEGDSVAVNQLFQEHGKSLSVESRDKYGKTLLMVSSCFVNGRDEDKWAQR